MAFDWNANSVFDEWLTRQGKNRDQLNPSQIAQYASQWWTSEGESAAKTAWNTYWQPWEDKYAELGSAPVGQQAEGLASYLSALGISSSAGALDTSGIETWASGALGSVNTNIEGLMQTLQAGTQQWNPEWEQQYASQLGFDSVESYREYLANLNAQNISAQENLQSYLTNPTQLTAEQEKSIRVQQAEAEANARKQAEAMYGETQSLAVLQRSNDELQRAAVSDSFKQSMEMAQQNYAIALGIAQQNADTFLQQSAQGQASFQQYVQVKQEGIAQAIEAWQAQASQILQQEQMKLQSAQAEWEASQRQYETAAGGYDSYLQQIEQNNSALYAAWEAQAKAIELSGYFASGMDQQWVNVSSEMYASFMQPIVDAAASYMEQKAVDTADEEAKSEADANGLRIAGGMVLLALGFILSLSTLGAAAPIGGTLMTLGGSMIGASALGG